MLYTQIIFTLFFTACVIFGSIYLLINAITSPDNRIHKLKDSLVFSGFMVFIWFCYVFVTIIFLIKGY
jgi:hypothetical protein